MEAKVYNEEGKKAADLKLDEAIFGLPWNADLVYQVITAMQENAREGIAHTKGRGEVRGGGKKPWKQKGTGRARHGSIRSPIWKGGGVTHGPTKDKTYGQKLNKKMKTKALYILLSRKWRDGEVIFLNELNFAAPKTKQAAATLNALAKATKEKTVAYKSGKRALITVPAMTVPMKKSFSNLGGTMLRSATDLNPLDLATYKHLVIVSPEQTLTKLAARQK